MKTKIVNQLAAVALFLASLRTTEAQALAPLPVAATPSSQSMSGWQKFGSVDPQTGLPVQTPWISADWIDPTNGTPPTAIVLTNVDFDGLSFFVVGHHLQEFFNGGFDLLIPPTFKQEWIAPTGEKFDLNKWPVSIHLHNVTASEVFRAMNLSFETQGYPFRWQLMMNGSRPTVLLRVLPEIMVSAHPLDPITGIPARGKPPVEEPRPMVIYVGDLMRDEKSGGMGLQQIVDTLLKVNKMAGIGDLSINASEDAQLIIIKGTDDQIVFTQSTLQALKQKVMAARVASARNAPVEPSAGETK